MAKAGHKHKLICPHESCEKSFSRESRFRAHINIHTGDRPFICEEEGCDKAFTRAQHLKRHVDISHRCITPEPVRCEYEDCQKIFSFQANLDRHIREVHKEASYACTEEGCTEKFRKHHQLKAHLFSHKGLLPFQCSVEDCLKKFSQKSHLVRHMKVHQGYKCTHENCDEVFPKWSLVRKHMVMMHPKVYSCTECKAEFPKPCLLKKHMVRHSGSLELFKCTYEGCPRSYVEMRNLNAHIRSYHEGKLFKCEKSDCDRKFTTKQKLLQHEKVHDPNLPPRRKKPKLNQHRKKSFAAKVTGVDEYKLKKEASNESVKSKSCTVTHPSDGNEQSEVEGKDLCHDVDLKNVEKVNQEPMRCKNEPSEISQVEGQQMEISIDNGCDVNTKSVTEISNESVDKITTNSGVLPEKRTFVETDEELHQTKKLRVTK